MENNRTKFRVMVADDHKLFRDGLAATLRHIRSVAYVTQAADGDEVMRQLNEQQCDLIFMDINMPGKNGLAATREIKQLYPGIKVIALTMHDDRKHIKDMFEAGASAYLLKNTDKAEIEDAIDTVMNGKNFYGKEVTEIFTHQAITAPAVQLNPHETEVLKMIYRELSTKEIAKKLEVSPRTVEGYRQSLFQKTKTQTIAGLIKFAIKNGYAE